MSTPLKKVLVVEDEESVCRFLKTTLESNQYQTRIEGNAQKGMQGAIEYRPDLIILDLGLPDMSGHELLKKVREWSTTPIIILTAAESDDDKVKALDSGADDYLTKPFSVRELLARMRVALRHSESVGQQPVFKDQNLEVDLVGHVVKVSGEIIHLTVTEYEILKVLIKNSGKVVTHRTFLKEIWGPNSVEHTQYLRVYVGQLRKKLKDAGDLIVTEPGVGYRLVSEENIIK